MDAQTQARLAKLDQVLRSVPREYQNKDRLRYDVQGLLRVLGTLQPHLGTFAAGARSATLFYLYGVLPINYKGASYNIPVTIYFDGGYPRQAPRCFVSPTENMAVAQNHPNVDQNGMFSAPMISSWNERTSTLMELTSVMISSFAAQPPVHAVAPGQRPGAQQQQQQQNQVVNDILGAVGGAATAVGGALGGLFNRIGSGGGAGGAGGAGGGAQSGASGAQSGAGGAQLHPRGAGGGTSQDQLIERATMKVRERWPIVVGKLVAEDTSQSDKREELKAQAVKLEQDIANLRSQTTSRESQGAQIEATKVELTAFVSENEEKEPDPDDLKAQLDPDRRQVLENLGEEFALEEFLTALDELLAAKKITADDFIREVRDVSRRKYMCMMQRKKSEAVVRASA